MLILMVEAMKMLSRLPAARWSCTKDGSLASSHENQSWSVSPYIITSLIVVIDIIINLITITTILHLLHQTQFAAIDDS